MMNFNDYSAIKDMPHDLPGALAYYHKHAEEARQKAERKFCPAFKLHANAEKHETNLLSCVFSFACGLTNIALYHLTERRRLRAVAAIQDDRLHDLVDGMVKFNLIQAIANDARKRKIIYEEMPISKSKDFKQILRYATWRVAAVADENQEHHQPE